MYEPTVGPLYTPWIGSMSIRGAGILIRKCRETKWIYGLKATEPLGLNEALSYKPFLLNNMSGIILHFYPLSSPRTMYK